MSFISYTGCIQTIPTIVLETDDVLAKTMAVKTQEAIATAKVTLHLSQQEPGGFPGPGVFHVNGTQSPYGEGMEGYVSNPFSQNPPVPPMVGSYNNNGFEQNQLMDVLNTSNAVST